MTARVLLAAALILIFSAAEVSAEEGFSLGEALAKIKKPALTSSVEARFRHDEFILRYEKFSLNYSNFDAEKNLRYVRLNVDNEIISLMGSGADWSYGLTGIAWKDGDHNFAPLPTIGVGIYLTVMPKTKVYTNFSGMTFGAHRHVGRAVLPQQKFQYYRRLSSRQRQSSQRLQSRRLQEGRTFRGHSRGLLKIFLKNYKVFSRAYRI